MAKRHERCPWEIPDTLPAIVLCVDDFIKWRRLDEEAERHLWTLKKKNIQVYLISFRYRKKFLNKILEDCSFEMVKHFKTAKQARDWMQFHEEILYLFMRNRDKGSVAGQGKYVMCESWKEIFDKLKE